jgi:hypothetical protein
MTSLLNFIKIYQLVQKLLGGTHRRVDRETGDLISPTFLFKESRLKMENAIYEQEMVVYERGTNVQVTSNLYK